MTDAEHEQRIAEALRIAVEAERKRLAALTLVEDMRKARDRREAELKHDIELLNERLVVAEQRALAAEQANMTVRFTSFDDLPIEIGRPN